MIFQDPLSSLHPLYRVGWQIVEMIRAHRPIGKSEAQTAGGRAARQVGIPRPSAGSTTTRTSSPAACGSAR